MATHSVSDSDEADGVLDAWRAITASALRTARATNRAMLAPLRASAAMTRASLPAEPVASIPSLAYEEEFWAFERSVDEAESISVGDSVRFTKRLTDEDVAAFAQASGDTNRLHLDEAFAAETRFGRRIVHGTLVSGMISAALARLPGLTIYLSQDLEFIAPVEIGAVLTAVVEVVEDLGNGQFRLMTDIENEAGEVVVDGEAVVLIDPMAADSVEE